MRELSPVESLLCSLCNDRWFDIILFVSGVSPFSSSYGQSHENIPKHIPCIMYSKGLMESHFN